MPSFAPLLLNTYYVSLAQDPVPSTCCPMWMGSCYKAVKAATSPGGSGRLSRWVPRLDLLLPISRSRCWLLEWPRGTCLTCLFWSSQARWRELGSRSEKPDVASGPWSPGEGLAPSSCLGLNQGEYFSKFDFLCLLLHNMCPETCGQIGES